MADEKALSQLKHAYRLIGCAIAQLRAVSAMNQARDDNSKLLTEAGFYLSEAGQELRQAEQALGIAIIDVPTTHDPISGMLGRLEGMQLEEKRRAGRQIFVLHALRKRIASQVREVSGSSESIPDDLGPESIFDAETLYRVGRSPWFWILVLLPQAGYFIWSWVR